MYMFRMLLRLVPITMASVVAVENSFTVGVGVAVMADTVIPLLVGTKIACMAAPLDVGV